MSTRPSGLARDTLRDVMQSDRPPSPLAMRTQPAPSKRPRLSLRAKGPARSDLPEGQPPELEHSPRQRQQLRHWRMRERMHGWVGAVGSGAHHARTHARGNSAAARRRQRGSSTPSREGRDAHESPRIITLPAVVASRCGTHHARDHHHEADEVSPERRRLRGHEGEGIASHEVGGLVGGLKQAKFGG